MKFAHRLARLAVVLVTAATALAGAPVRAALPPLVPRDVFIGNPVKTALEISPDGQQLSYLAPSKENVLNVWVKTIGKSDDRMVTKDMKRGIRIHAWAEDSKHVIYLQDVDGNENWHVNVVDLGSGDVRDLNPQEGVRAQNLITDEKHPDEILVGLNQRDPKVFDMHRIKIATGESQLDTQNPGDVAGWGTDPDFVIRAAQAANQADGSTILRVRDSAASPWRDLVTLPPEENGGFVDFTADGKAAYVLTSIGADVTRLAKMDLATGKELETLATDPRCDVSDVMVQKESHTVQAVAFEYLRNEWKVLDPSIAADFEALKKVHDGDFEVVSRDRKDDTWVISYVPDDGPVSYYVYNRATKKAAFQFVNRPALEKLKLAKMQPVVIDSRDGQKLVSYLTLPAGVPGKNLPMVLLVHGGPWGRDSWGYNGQTQWLANRGYAVLQVNFRASTGFGKKFLHLGDLQWGGTMQDDLTDAVKWAVKQGIADPKRVAIMGGSYGGYATLAGLTFTPELYACGVDIVGPSNLKTLLAAIPPYWGVFRKTFELRMGPVDRDSALNQRISPLFHVDQVRVPLLIGQGLKDPRVNVNESDQIAAAMREKNLPVEYVVYTDEGHGFVRPENRLDFYGRAEEFLAKHIGGRAQPFSEVKGASVQVKEPPGKAETAGGQK